MGRGVVLKQVEAELERISGRRCAAVLDRWRQRQPVLAVPEVRSLAELPGWVWAQRYARADQVVRCLVALAQDGEQLAALLVIACLRPGLCALARRMHVDTDDVVPELTLAVLEFPLDRRCTVAGQLLLEARLRLFRQAEKRQKDRSHLLDGGQDLLDRVVGTTGQGLCRSVLEEIAVRVIDAWQEGRLTEDTARVILETRVAGESVASAATRRSVSCKTLLQRRWRGEAVLAHGRWW